MTRNQILGGKKTMRTQITDLPQIAVELSEREMRIVSGGLSLAMGLGCGGGPIIIGPAKNRTDYNTGGDHDPDWTK
jgi:hypothetical protein